MNVRAIQDAYAQIGAEYRSRVDEITQEAKERAEEIAKRREEAAEKIEQLKAEAQKKADEAKAAKEAKAAGKHKDEGEEDDKPKPRVDPWAQTRTAAPASEPVRRRYFEGDEDEHTGGRGQDEPSAREPARQATVDEGPEDRQVKDPWAQALPSSQEQRTSAYYDDEDDEGPPPLTNEW